MSQTDPFDSVDRTDLESPHANQPEYNYEHVLVENDGGPDELAIFPHDADEDGLAATWISASGESFVSLDDMR